MVRLNCRLEKTNEIFLLRSIKSMKYFYSHLVEIESLIIELDKLELSASEKKYLARLADETLHHAVLDAILAKLTEQEKIIFLEHLRNGRDDQIWKLLNTRVKNVEEEIKDVIEEVKEDLHQDLKEARKLKEANR